MFVYFRSRYSTFPLVLTELTTSATHLSWNISRGINGAERISLTVLQVSWEATKATSAVESMHTTCYHVPCQIRRKTWLDEVQFDIPLSIRTKYLLRFHCQGGSYGPFFGHSCHPKNICPLLVTSQPFLPNNIQSLCRKTVPNASEALGLLRGSGKNKENVIPTHLFFFSQPNTTTIANVIPTQWDTAAALEAKNDNMNFT